MQNGQPFRPLDDAARPPVVPPDPEGIAFDGARATAVLVQRGRAGDRRSQRVALLDPSVRIATLDGGYVGEFTLPPVLHMSTDQTGPRQNRGWRGSP